MFPSLCHLLEAGDDILIARVIRGSEAQGSIVDESVRRARVRPTTGDRIKIHSVGNNAVEDMKQEYHQGQPYCRGGATTLSSAKKRLENGSVIVCLRYPVHRLHSIPHELKCFRVEANCIFGHAAPSGGQYAKSNNNAVVARRSIVIKSGEIVF